MMERVRGEREEAPADWEDNFKQIQDLKCFLNDLAHNPKPLSQCCLDAIRDHFRESSLPLASMASLPLPSHIRTMLFYGNEEMVKDD